MADLAQASPATVSRCGMVYIDPNEMGYMPMVRSWIDDSTEKNLFSAENAEFVSDLFEMLAAGIKHVNTKCRFGIKQVNTLIEYSPTYPGNSDGLAADHEGGGAAGRTECFP